MDRIREMLSNLTELSTEEIETLHNEIVNEFNAISEADLSHEVVTQMTELADAADSLSSERGRRETELAELSAARDAAAARLNPQEPAAEESVEEETVVASAEEPVVEEVESETTELAVEEPATEEVVETEVAELAVEEVPAEAAAVTEEDAVVASEEEPEEEAPVATEEAPETEEVEEVVSEETPAEEDSEATETTEETVTASASASENLQVEVPEGNLPQPTENTLPPVTITAGADIPGYSVGQSLPNMRAVAQAIIDRKKAMGRVAGAADGEQQTVATFTTSFPENRVLASDDTDGNSDKISSVVSPEAITAAGGLCAPVEVRYDIFGFGELGRPVRDSLAVFSADRGGIRFVTPPVLGDLTGAVSLWTLEDDRNAATEGAPDPVKPCIRVACGQEIVVYTDAIPLCLTFGNMNARAYPELVERHTQLGMIQHARYAETRLLTRIGALSTKVTSEIELGAARDILVAIDQAAAGYRSRHRLDVNSPLRVIFPEWFKSALRADLVKQIPGDGIEAAFNLADAQINSFLAVRNINVTWAMDGETGQVFGAQTDGALLDFPENVVWYLFAEGTFLFLDGGTLDLGLVRDSTLNGTNDYKIFLETFEGLAKVGIESLRVETGLAIAGASASTVDTITSA